ncbi:MAG: hypothetical protein ACK452_11195 [Bacteroidota bacterium]|jgi:hypothetical protein
MKKIFFVFILVLTFQLNAQSNKKRAEYLSSNIAKLISLTKDEKAKVYDVVLNNLNAIDKSIKDNGNNETAQPVMIEKRKFFSDMSAVLTEEQFQNWQRIRSEQLTQYRNGEKISEMIFDPKMETIIKK